MYTSSMQLVIFLGSFLVLFLLSHLVTTTLGQVLMRLTRSTILSINILAIIFFPGVLVHELGHFLMASFLFVPTGEIEFLPKVQEGGIKLGSVAIGHTDPLRRFLIGVAPFVSGLGIFFLASYYLTPLIPLSWRSIFFMYILFEIGNTMFSSKKDLEGALGLLGIMAFIGLGLFFLGARLPESILKSLEIFVTLPIFAQMSWWLWISGGINFVVWVVLKTLFLRRKHY